MTAPLDLSREVDADALLALVEAYLPSLRYSLICDNFDDGHGLVCIAVDPDPVTVLIPWRALPGPVSSHAICDCPAIIDTCSGRRLRFVVGGAFCALGLQIELEFDQELGDDE